MTGNTAQLVHWYLRRNYKQMKKEKKSVDYEEKSRKKEKQ